MDLWKLVIRTKNKVLQADLEYKSACKIFAECKVPNKMLIPNKYKWNFHSTMGWIWS